MMVGVVNTLRVRGQRFEPSISCTLIGTVEARSPICRDVGMKSNTIDLRNEEKLRHLPLVRSMGADLRSAA